MPKDRIVGLDIGTSKVRCAVVEFDSNRLSDILGIGEAASAGVKGGAIVNIAAAAEAILSAVSRARSSSKCEIRRVIAGISGQHIASLNSHAVTAVARTSRRVAAEDVDRAIDQSKVIVLPPDREIVYCCPRAYKIDGQDGIANPVGMYGNRLELESHIVTGNFSHAHNLIAAVRTAGLEIAFAVPSAIASAQAVLKPEERSMGVMLLDIGSDVTDVALFTGGVISYSAVVPVGGRHITGDLCAALNLSFEDAELLKKGCGVSGCSVAAPDIAGRATQVVHSRIRELFGLVRHELIKSGAYNLLSAGVVITGGSANSGEIFAVSEEVLKMPTRVGIPISADRIPKALLRPEYAAVLGLAVHAGENPPPQPSRGQNALNLWLKQVVSKIGLEGYR